MYPSSLQSHTGPGKYSNFSLVFARTGKSLKIVGGPGKSWKSVNSGNKVCSKELRSSQMGRSNNLKILMCTIGPGKKKLSEA